MPGRPLLVFMFAIASVGLVLVARGLYTYLWAHDLVQGALLLGCASLFAVPLFFLYRKQRRRSQRQLEELEASNKALLERLHGADSK